MSRPAADGAAILSARRAASVLTRHRRRGRVIVFTNGCFDLIHVGHVALLEEARALGDLLVVGVNSDRSVRRLKGPGRPLIPLPERLELLSGLRAVDYVVSFDTATPAGLIDLLRPSVLVKGGDYRRSEIVGRETVEAGGGTVVTIPIRHRRSTSMMIRRVGLLARARRAARRRHR